VDPAVLQVEVRTGVDGPDGLLTVRSAKSAGDLDVTIGGVTKMLPAGGGTIRVPSPARWWPHTHGEPVLYELEVRADTAEVRRAVGFRELTHARDLEQDGLDLYVNGVSVFTRGAVWTPTPATEVRSTLERARDGGLNMIRVVGTMVYEDAIFHDACDELGLLVWQDLMFANMDYPFEDEAFATLVTQEVRQALNEVAGRPSLAIVCGNSEVEQQVAMLGLQPEFGRNEFFISTLPAIMQSIGVDSAYIPSAPTGGTLPFRTNRGVANYFGVGAYLRDLGDVRRAAVTFASECLAFANVPDAVPTDRSAGVARDVGADWDFADVRDHYLRVLHGVTPDDPEYWEQARNVTGELMALVFGEWRRAKSPCTGGLVLWLRDLEPGAGWGLLDSDGRPKAAWHHLRRAVAPIAVWLVDEGLNGLAVHVANDAADVLRAALRISLYRDEQLLVGEVETELVLEPHSSFECDVEVLLGRFVDIGYAYRFGERQHDTVVATLHRDGNELSKAFHKTICGARRKRVGLEELGLRADATVAADGTLAVRIAATRLVHGVRLKAPGFEAEDDSFDLEPSRAHTVVVRSRNTDAVPCAASVTALDLEGELEVSFG
jgi:beta-mannosidase